RVEGWGSDFVGNSGLRSGGAVVGATYPAQLKRARELMPHATILGPGDGAQGGGASGAGAAARPDGLGAIGSASRAVMGAYLKAPGQHPLQAAADAIASMCSALNDALAAR